jgi:hypothetical protein
VERVRPIRPLSPELRRVVKECLVPLMVKRYVANVKPDNHLAPAGQSVAQCPKQSTATAEVVQ